MAFILAVDYDGTLFDDSFPKRGEPKMDIANKVKEFIAEGAEAVLWTCREHNALKEAVQRCKDELGIEFVSVNSNAPTAVAWIKEEVEKSGDTFGERKIYADFYLDDKAMNLDIFLKIDVKKTCAKFANRDH